jgi:hypothetical protein
MKILREVSSVPGPLIQPAQAPQAPEHRIDCKARGYGN